MRRIALMTVFLLVVPSTVAAATELDDLMEQGRDASYSAEQIISCATPDGGRDAIVRMSQEEGELRVSSAADEDVEVVAGAGGWALMRGGGLVAEAVVGGSRVKTEPLYEVEEDGSVEFLGREAMSYRLVRDGVVRAVLVFDDETGALMSAVTFTLDGEVYCERRFVSFDTMTADSGAKVAPEKDGVVPPLADQSSLPVDVEGFELLDHYEEDDGFSFAYYSDGFFSFALFETPTTVTLPDATRVDLGSGKYDRWFSAGQVTYAWDTLAGGMALVGDLPPDLHEPVLDAMPHPQDPGLFRRWWRALFG